MSNETERPNNARAGHEATPGESQRGALSESRDRGEAPRPSWAVSASLRTSHHSTPRLHFRLQKWREEFASGGVYADIAEAAITAIETELQRRNEALDERSSEALASSPKRTALMNIPLA